MFQNHQGSRYDDVSALSGLDNIADGRCWVRWDFDRDGWSDVALCNADYPLLNLYRNLQSGWVTDAKPQHFLALRLVGGNFSGTADAELSNRDAVGARVSLRAGDLTVTYHRQSGEGFAAQNSSTLLFGLGHRDRADELTIYWPSGRVTRSGSQPANQWLWAFETTDTAPHGELFELRPYQSNASPVSAAGPSTVSVAVNPTMDPLPLEQLIGRSSHPTAPQLHLFTTTATWCEACHRLQPQLHRIAGRFGDAIALHGVPVDPIESAAELTAFAERTKPAYAMLTNIGSDEREAIVAAIRRQLNTESLPCTLVTNRDGHVLKAFLGVPTVSDIGRLLADVQAQPEGT